MHSDWFIVVGGLAHDLATNMLYLMHELTSMPRPQRSPAGVEARARSCEKLGSPGRRKRRDQHRPARGLLTVEGREATFHVEIGIAFHDHTLAMDRAGAAVTDSCDRPTHHLAIRSTGLNAPAVTVYVSNPNYTAHESL